eukprot:3348828-Pyramimonas_sp.AAC.1
MRKEITDRLEKSETRLNAMEQMAQVNSRLPPFVNSQGGKRRAVDSSAGDGSTTGGSAGGGSSLEDAHRLLIL